MSFYRIESAGIGIYEAVERDCPRDDSRRQSKPDGSWLPKIGPQYPGAISFWSETGLRSYVASGLFDWHRRVVCTPITVRVADTFERILFQDEFQVIVDRDESSSTTNKSGSDFVVEKAWQWLRCPQDRDGITVALQLLSDNVGQAANKAKAVFELAGAYDFLGKEEIALQYYEEITRLGIDQLPAHEQHQFYIQLGSTLRNCLRLKDSRRVLNEGIAMFQHVAALKAFLGLTEYTDGNYRDAAKYFGFALAANEEQDSSIGDYQRALNYYLANLDVIPVKIRQATNADIAEIKDLIFSVLVEYSLKPDPENTDADLKDIELNYTRSGGMFDVVESADGSLIGTVGLFPLDSKCCELRKMYLAKSARGLGLGKKLMDRVLKQARELGFTTIELETANVLNEAIRLYKHYGFKEIVRSHLSSRCDQAYVLDLSDLAVSEQSQGQVIGKTLIGKVQESVGLETQVNQQ